MSQTAQADGGPTGLDEVGELRCQLARQSLLFDVLAHDLRSPLAAVAGFADLLADSGDLSDPGRAALIGSLRVGTARMWAILANVSDWAQVEAGRVQARRLFTDLAALVDRVVRGLEITDRRVEVRVVRAFDYVDHFMVERITENLVLNAARHSPPGSAIRVELLPAPRGLELIVSDTGPGVAPELAMTVFDRFGRGGTGDRRGLGLGLLLVRRFAELHGGCAWLDRPGGPGASFHVLVATGGPRAGDAGGR